MYLTTKSFKSGTYLYLMESKYDPDTKKAKKMIVKTFGKYDEFVAARPDEYAELVRQYGKNKEKAKDKREASITDFFNELNSRNLQDATSDNSKSFNYMVTLNYSHLLFRKMWNEDLQMPKFFDYLVRHNQLDIQYSISNIALYFSVLKIMEPMSYLAGMESSLRFIGDPMSQYSTDDVYRCLHVLAEYKEQIMKHLSGRIDKIIPREKSLIFYDCTNCYFETPYNDIYWYRKKAQRILRRELRKDNQFSGVSDRELNIIIDETPEYASLLSDIIESFGDPMRMHGASKEKRFDLPLVSIALVIDDHAIPIDFQVYAGNQAETSTMIESIKKLKEKYEIKNAILVADAALNGTKNLSMLLNEGLGFAVSKSALTFDKSIRKNHLNLSKYKQMKDESGQDTKYLYKIITYKNKVPGKENGESIKHTIECQMMITFSEARKSRDLATMEANIQRAKQAISKHEQVNTSKSGWKQFVITTILEDTQDGKKTSDKTIAKTASNGGTNSNKTAADNFKSPANAETDNTGSVQTAEANCEKCNSSESGINSNESNSKQDSQVQQNDGKNKKESEKKTKSKKQKQEKTTSKNKEKHIATYLNEQLIQKRRECAGFSGILFHQAPDTKEELTAEYVSTLYHHLVEIEECFRIMKNDLEIRPLYVRDKSSIIGHILLCVVSLIMIRMVQNTFKKSNKTITASQLQDILKNLKLQTYYRNDKCFLIKSHELDKRNCLRGSKGKIELKEMDNDNNDNEITNDNFINRFLGFSLPPVSTMENIRSLFKMRSLNLSEDQLNVITKNCNIDMGA